MRIPINCSQRAIASRARAVFHYSLDAEKWDYLESDPDVFGPDCVIVLYPENKCELAFRIFGTSRARVLSDSSTWALSIDTQTFKYALLYDGEFMFALVDVASEEIRFVSAKDYAAAHKSIIKGIASSRRTVTVRFTYDDILKENDDRLENFALRSSDEGAHPASSSLPDLQMTLY